MKVFLGVERDAPPGWVLCGSPGEVIELLYSGEVTEVSLDFELGDDAGGTGYDVLLWIEDAVGERGWTPPRMSVHSSNPPAREKMEAALTRIEKFLLAHDDHSQHRQHGNFLTSDWWELPAWYAPAAAEPVRLEHSAGIGFYNFFEFGDRMVLGVERSWKNFRSEFLNEGWKRPLVPEPMAIWDTRTGERNRFLRGHHFGNVRGAELLEDGRLITWGRDHLVRVWDLSTGVCTDILPLPLWPHPADRRAVLSCTMFAEMKPSEKLRYINTSHLPSPDVRIDWIVKPGGKQYSFKYATRSEKRQNVVKPWSPNTDQHVDHRIWDLDGAEGGYSDWFITSTGRLCGGGTTYGSTGQFYVWDGNRELRILFVGLHCVSTHLLGEVEPNTITIVEAGVDSDDTYKFIL